MAHFKLRKDIHLNHTVKHVHYDETDKRFYLQIYDSLRRQILRRSYDFVIVASGHFSKPYVPAIPGHFTGEAIHSHVIRDFNPALFQNKQVAIVGLQLSGIDVLMYVLKYYGSLRSLIVVCNLEFITSRKSIKSLWERGAFVHKERITEYAGGRRVAFSDGDVREVDTLYFCTGYEYSFPFLEEGTLQRYGAGEHSKGLGPLYLRSVHVEKPGLMFVGLTENVPIIQYGLEWTAILVSQIALGRLKWSREELRALHKAEIEYARSYDPDLSRFHRLDHKKYDYMAFISSLKKACRVPASFNFL